MKTKSKDWLWLKKSTTLSVENCNPSTYLPIDCLRHANHQVKGAWDPAEFTLWQRRQPPTTIHHQVVLYQQLWRSNMARQLGNTSNSKFNTPVNAGFESSRLSMATSGYSVRFASLYCTEFQRVVYGGWDNTQWHPHLLPGTTVLQDCTSAALEHEITYAVEGGSPSINSPAGFAEIILHETINKHHRSGSEKYVQDLLADGCCPSDILRWINKTTGGHNCPLSYIWLHRRLP